MPSQAAPTDPTPPFGSWRRTYAFAAIAAVLVMLLLWWMTAALNHTPLATGAGR